MSRNTCGFRDCGHIIDHKDCVQSDASFAYNYCSRDCMYAERNARNEENKPYTNVQCMRCEKRMYVSESLTNKMLMDIGLWFGGNYCSQDCILVAFKELKAYYPDDLQKGRWMRKSDKKAQKQDRVRARLQRIAETKGDSKSDSKESKREKCLRESNLRWAKKHTIEAIAKAHAERIELIRLVANKDAEIRLLQALLVAQKS